MFLFLFLAVSITFYCFNIYNTTITFEIRTTRWRILYECNKTTIQIFIDILCSYFKKININIKKDDNKPAQIQQMDDIPFTFSKMATQEDYLSSKV